MSNFWLRLITGTVFVIVLALAIMTGVSTSAALFFIASIIGCGEYLSILEKGKKPTPIKFWSFLSITVVHVTFYLVSADLAPPKVLLAAIPVFMTMALVELFNKKPEGITRIAHAFMGTIWIGVPFAALSFLGTINGLYNGWLVLGFFILLWVNDTGAYLTGRSFGKHKLAPSISPGKTIEGFIGGVLLALVAAYFMADFVDALTQTQWLVVALIIGVFSNAGDLVESLLKRSCGVKDSGNILPGHGGILDRFDGILLAVPVILAYLLLTI